jgi:hypothetical protein
MAKPAPRRQRATESLGNIIGAFTQELAKASLAADVMRLKMKNAYASNALLKEFEPSKIRIVTARVTLPVAFDSQSSGAAIDPGLSESQIRLMLSKELPLATRDRVTARIMAGLGSLNRLSDNRLAANLGKAASAIKINGFDPRKHFDAKPVSDFKKEWVANKVPEREARFLYRAEDLEEQDPNNIVKLDITLDVSY